MTWRREDLGYGAAAAAAVALLVYLVAGNFGLVPSPLTPRGVAETPSVLAVDAFAPSTSDPQVDVAPVAAPPTGPAAAAASPTQRGDVAAPNVAITTEPGTSVALAEPASVEGTARDIGTGIGEVLVTFTRDTGTRTVPAVVTCDDTARETCVWRAEIPNVVGSYSVSARASDAAGNTGSAGPINVTVVNTGGPVRTVTDTAERVPGVLGDVVDGVARLLGL